MAAPAIGANNILKTDTLTVTSENFAKEFLHDDLIARYYRGLTAITQDIKTDAGVGNTSKVSFFGMVYHDSTDPRKDGNGAVTLTFASSPDDAVYTTIFTVTPTTDDIIFRTFAEVDVRFYRLRITRGLSFRIGIGQASWGVRIDLGDGFEVGFDPQTEDHKVKMTQTQKLNIAGTTRERANRRAVIRATLVTEAFTRGTTIGQFEEFWNNVGSKGIPFFFGWNPGNPGSFEKDAFFGAVQPNTRIRRPLATNLTDAIRDIEFTIVGQKDK